MCMVAYTYNSSTCEVETGAWANILRPVSAPSLQNPGVVVHTVTLELRR